MIEVSQKEFEDIITQAVGTIPEPYKSRLQNVAFIAEDEVGQAQSQKMKLAPGGLLFGLYEGLPLPARGGATKILPDKITIYKKPHELVSQDLDQFKEKVRHTIWHEVAHYFGLDHKRIDELENKG